MHNIHHNCILHENALYTRTYLDETRQIHNHDSLVVSCHQNGVELQHLPAVGKDDLVDLCRQS